MTLEMAYKKQKLFYEANNTKSYNYRYTLLKKLKEVIMKNEEAILDSLYKDLNKSKKEAYITEFALVKRELNYVLKNLRKWIKPSRKKISMINFKSTGYTSFEPLGISLIVSPWNYPFNLSFIPLIYSIAAGNCVIVKCSSNSINTSSLLKQLIDEFFLVENIFLFFDKKNTKEIFSYKYDHIFFTGGIETGKLFMKHASQTITPISLELGGKSPVIIDKDVNIDIACKRIIFGKIINAGQTCVAPDYLLVPRYNKTKVIKALQKYINLFTSDSLIKDDYPKIINNKEFTRLIELLKDENIIYGGNFDSKNLKIEPTLVNITNLKSKLMSEEIFGPILPIITYENLDDAINIVKNFSKPLALYLFTNNKKNIKKILNELSFGGCSINDCLSHITEENLPFGGVGDSGIGKYHGKQGFITFSNERSILHKSVKIDLPFRYPNYKDKDLKKIKRFL